LIVKKFVRENEVSMVFIEECSIYIRWQCSLVSFC